jgi:hypothetical protein
MIPNERPTPLTDAAWADKEQNILVHAKTLERSLAERTEERDKWANVAAQYSAEREHNANMALAYKAERDTALAKLAAVTAERDALKAKLATINHIAMSLFVRSTSSEVTGEMAEIGRLSREDGQ